MQRVHALAFTDTTHITGNYNSTTGVLTLTGSDTLADYQAAHRGLYGRYPSFARLMKNARIKDQILVFDEL